MGSARIVVDLNGGVPMKRTLLTVSALLLSMASARAIAQTYDESTATVEPGSEPIATQQAVIEEQQSNQLLTADLIGADVFTHRDGRIGTLSGLLFDQNDTIVGGVVSVGGFLGIGAKEVALSWDQFDVRPEESLVYVSVTQVELEAAPEFKDRTTIDAEQDAARAQAEFEAQQDALQDQAGELNEGQTGGGDTN